MNAVCDRILVRAPVGVVYATLTDVDGWSRWWRGCRTGRAALTEGSSEGSDLEGDRHRIVLVGRWRRRSIDVRAHGWRHDLGLRLDLLDRRGRPLGVAEWWLERCHEGTIVQHIIHGDGHGSQQHAYLRAVRAGLQDLKDHLELAVAVAAGRLP